MIVSGEQIVAEVSHGGTRGIECEFPAWMDSIEIENARAELSAYLGGRATIHSFDQEGEPISRLFAVRFIDSHDRRRKRDIHDMVDDYLEGLGK